MFQIGKMYVDDLLHGLAVRKSDVMEETTAQKGVRQLFLVVGGDDDNRAMSGLDRAARLIDVELHPIELEQKIVGELYIGLVYLVDQQDRCLRRLERFPEFSRHDVVGDIVYPLVTELAVAQTRHRIIFVEPLLRLRRRFDVPGDQVSGDSAGDLMGENRLAGSRLTLDEEGAFECDRGVDRHPKILGSDIGVGALE